jgi:hypothetical protein
MTDRLMLPLQVLGSKDYVKVAKSYGFEKAITPLDIVHAHPDIYPFRSFSKRYDTIKEPVAGVNESSMSQRPAGTLVRRLYVVVVLATRTSAFLTPINSMLDFPENLVVRCDGFAHDLQRIMLRLSRVWQQSSYCTTRRTGRLRSRSSVMSSRGESSPARPDRPRPNRCVPSTRVRVVNILSAAYMKGSLTKYSGIYPCEVLGQRGALQVT